jgi:predicted RNA methylase
VAAAQRRRPLARFRPAVQPGGRSGAVVDDEIAFTLDVHAPRRRARPSRKLAKAIALVRREGIVGSVRHVASILYWSFVTYRDDTRFDRRYGIDTSGVECDYLANVRSDYVAGATYYEASKRRDFVKMMRWIPADRRAATFIDLGCGKGRVLCFAALDGFEHIVGVEFSDELASAARTNIETFTRRTRTSASIAVLTQDVATFAFPETDIVLYLYNPFTAELMQIVIDRVVACAARTRRRVYIAYRNPQCGALFDTHPAIETIAREPAFGVYTTRGRT